MEVTIGNAESKARDIIDEAIKAADAKKREASLEIKEETIKARHDFEKEQRNAGVNCRSTKSAYSTRKKLLTRKQRCWSAGNSL